LNDVQNPDVRVTKIMNIALSGVFPESHRLNLFSSSVDLSFLPLKYFDESIPEIDIELLIRNMTICLRDRHGDTNYKRSIRKFAEMNGLRLNHKNLIDISIIDDPVEIRRLENQYDSINNSDDKNSPFLFIYKDKNGENLSKRLFRISLDNGNENSQSLSATIDQVVLNYCFGAGRVSFYDCKNAKYEGTLNQYTANTMSRADIAKNPGIINKITSQTGNDIRITFKKYCRGNEKYFGKITGIDSLKGHNIDVVGTPHQPDFVYKLFAHTLGFEFDVDSRMRYQLIRHNNVAFWFMTFDRELLRNIQLWMIGSELEQAVGRARLIHCNCIVNVYSNFPLCQANLIEADTIVSQ